MNAVVHLVLVDADTGSVFAEADLPVAELPETFAEATTLSLGEHQWSVVKAEPPAAADFARTGQVRLTLRRMQMIDPEELLFTLPTISDELPPCAPGGAEGALSLHEDAWRQVELLGEASDAAAEACLAGIERIHREKRLPSGAFEEIHLRSEVPDPLAGTRVTAEALRAAFPGAVELGGVALEGSGRVVDGFALRLRSGACVYGLWKEGRAGVLGIERGTGGADAEEEAEALAGLMARHGLRLVDWCRCAVVPAEGEAVAGVLRGE